MVIFSSLYSLCLCLIFSFKYPFFFFFSYPSFITLFHSPFQMSYFFFLSFLHIYIYIFLINQSLYSYHDCEIYIFFFSGYFLFLPLQYPSFVPSYFLQYFVLFCILIYLFSTSHCFLFLLIYIFIYWHIIISDLLISFNNLLSKSLNVCRWNNSINHHIQGLTTNVTVNGYSLSGWKMTPIPLTNITRLSSALRKLHDMTTSLGLSRSELTGTPRGGMAIYQGSFNVPNNSSHPQDTFLRLDGWGKVRTMFCCIIVNCC